MQQMDQRNDAELLTEFAADGCHAAFAALVNRHGPMAHGIAMRILSSHHDAQDVTQAVFILLARDAKKLASSPSVAGWIHTVTRRLALNAHDSRARRQRREHTAMEHATTTTTLNSAQEASCRRELDAAIAQLPERYSQPLLLVYLEGAPMDEVAKRLSLHPDTLRTRLSRACGKLRELLGQRGVEIASVTVLSSFLTDELEASSAFSPELASTVLNGATGGASVSPHVLALTAKGAISTSISLSTLLILMKTKATIVIATIVTLSVIGGAMLHFNNNSDPSTSVVSDATVPASSQARTTQSLPFTQRTSQGKPSSRNTDVSTADDQLAPVRLSVSKRILASDPRPIIKGILPGNLTWSKDGLALLGLDEGQQERLQEALDQASARALVVIKRKVKPLPKTNDGKYVFEIPDWSEEEGVALREEMTKALERELSAADAAFLMNDLSTDAFGPEHTISSSAGQALFGKHDRKLTFSMEEGKWQIRDDVNGNFKSKTAMSELPKEWVELFNLSKPGK